MNNAILDYLRTKYGEEKPDLFDVGVSQSTATAPAVTPPPPAPDFGGLTMADLPVNHDNNGISTDIMPGDFGVDPVDVPPAAPLAPEPPQMPQIAALPPKGIKPPVPPVVAPPAPSAPPSAPIVAPVGTPPADPLAGYSDADRKKVIEASEPGAAQYAGEGIAALGDSVARAFGRTGQSGNHLKGAIDAVEENKKGALNEFDKNRATAQGNYEVARQIVANNRADVDRATMTDPNSPVSKAQQALLDKIEPGVDHTKINALQAEIIAKPMLEGYKISEAGKNRKMMTDYLMNKKDEEVGTKFEQEMNASKARAGALGDNQKRLNASERVLNLIDQVKGNPNAMQTPEVAQAVASLVGGGGGVVSQQQIEHLMPQSMVGNANKFIGWLTNNPKGLEQQKFIASFMHTAERERDLINRQMTIAQAKSASGYMDYVRRNPEQARAKLEAQGVPEPMIQKILAGDFKDIDKLAPTSAPAIPKMPTHDDAQIPEYASEAEAAAANPPVGSYVKINGVRHLVGKS